MIAKGTGVVALCISMLVPSVIFCKGGSSNPSCKNVGCVYSAEDIFYGRAGQKTATCDPTGDVSNDTCPAITKASLLHAVGDKITPEKFAEITGKQVTTSFKDLGAISKQKKVQVTLPSLGQQAGFSFKAMGKDGQVVRFLFVTIKPRTEDKKVMSNAKATIIAYGKVGDEPGLTEYHNIICPAELSAADSKIDLIVKSDGKVQVPSLVAGQPATEVDFFAYH